MNPPSRLLAGYRNFRGQRYPEQSALYHTLSSGQSPKTMVVACADSRIDPATIFSASPGELFVLRNVANLIPPYEDDGGHHGTSAALEFAVNGVKVDHIVILGHAQCGGIKACLESRDSPVPGTFIGPWVKLADAAREEVLREFAGAAPAELLRTMELVAIRHSLRNLETFPFVRQAITERGLQLHGAWFSIAAGQLHWLDRETGCFEQVVADVDSLS